MFYTEFKHSILVQLKIGSFKYQYRYWPPIQPKMLYWVLAGTQVYVSIQNHLVYFFETGPWYFPLASCTLNMQINTFTAQVSNIHKWQATCKNFTHIHNIHTGLVVFNFLKNKNNNNTFIFLMHWYQSGTWYRPIHNSGIGKSKKKMVSENL